MRGGSDGSVSVFRRPDVGRRAPRAALYRRHLYLQRDGELARPHQPCPGDAGARLCPARPALYPRTHDTGRGGGGPRQAEATVRPSSGVQEAHSSAHARAWYRSRQALFRRAAYALGLSERLPYLGHRLRLPPTSRYVVLGAVLPVELVDTDLPAE